MHGEVTTPILAFHDVRELTADSTIEKAGNGGEDTFNCTRRPCLKWTFFE